MRSSRCCSNSAVLIWPASDSPRAGNRGHHARHHGAAPGVRDHRRPLGSPPRDGLRAGPGAASVARAVCPSLKGRPSARHPSSPLRHSARVSVDPQLSRFVAVSIPMLGSVIGLVISHMVAELSPIPQRIDAMNRVLRENLADVRVARACSRLVISSVRSGQSFVHRFVRSVRKDVGHVPVPRRERVVHPDGDASEPVIRDLRQHLGDDRYQIVDPHSGARALPGGCRTRTVVTVEERAAVEPAAGESRYPPTPVAGAGVGIVVTAGP